MGAFGIKIPKEYGGLGLSQLSYVRAMEMVTSKDGSLVALLSASQSIGVPRGAGLWSRQKKINGNENRRNRTPVGTNADTRPPWR